MAIELVRVKAAVQKEQRRLRYVLELYERDRKLVGFEIHDGFIQEATAALLALQAYDTLQEVDPRARETHAQALRLLQEAIAEARRLISGLRPVILEDFGVVAAIENLIQTARTKTGLDIEWLHHVYFDRLTPPLEAAIFRIAQESLTNASRHSKSRRVRVELAQQADRACITVQDWGCGFDLQATNADRYGLQGIWERARLFGGKASIQSAPGKGTRDMERHSVTNQGPQ